MSSCNSRYATRQTAPLARAFHVDKYLFLNNKIKTHTASIAPRHGANLETDMKTLAFQNTPPSNVETSISAVLLRGVCRTRMCTPLVAPMKHLKKKA